mgnify:CR=1 FL=1
MINPESIGLLIIKISTGLHTTVNPWPDNAPTNDFECEFDLISGCNHRYFYCKSTSVIGSVWGDFELSLHLVKGNKILCSRWCRTQGEPRDAHGLSYPITLNLFSTVRRIDDTAVKTFDEICSYQIIRLMSAVNFNYFNIDALL